MKRKKVRKFSNSGKQIMFTEIYFFHCIIGEHFQLENKMRISVLNKLRIPLWKKLRTEKLKYKHRMMFIVYLQHAVFLLNRQNWHKCQSLVKFVAHVMIILNGTTWMLIAQSKIFFFLVWNVSILLRLGWELFKKTYNFNFLFIFLIRWF